MLVIVSGFGIASYHPEGYKTAHFFTGEKRVTGMAIFAVGGNLGFALGPIIAIYIIKYMGFFSLPVIIVPSVVFVAIIIFYWRDISITEIKGDKAADREFAHERRKGTYISLSIVIAIVIMRSWTQMGLMSYIPFYYINHLKGDPLYAGNLVFVLG
jgi:FSR family fosmidomycin resistance protein-like MFS transporter